MLATLGIAQVEHDAALAPVVEREGRVRHVVVDAQRSEHATHRITGGRLDLDHVRAPVGEQGRGRRRGHPHPELDDAQVGERLESTIRVAHRPTLARSSSLTTLPVALVGSESTTSTTRGTL